MLPSDGYRFALAVFVILLLRFDNNISWRFLRTRHRGLLCGTKALPSFDSVCTIATAWSDFVDFALPDVVRLYIELVRSHAEYHLFDVSKYYSLPNELDLFWCQMAALLLVSIVGQLLILQSLLLFEKGGLLGDHQSGSLVVLPLGSAPMVFFFNGHPLVVLSQLCLEGFFRSLLYHLVLSLFCRIVLRRRLSNKDLMLIEKLTISKDNVFR